jgi:hypothetical protein
MFRSDNEEDQRLTIKVAQLAPFVSVDRRRRWPWVWVCMPFADVGHYSVARCPAGIAHFLMPRISPFETVTPPNISGQGARGVKNFDVGASPVAKKDSSSLPGEYAGLTEAQ